MLRIFNVNLGNHLLEPEVTALTLIINNQNMIPGFLETLKNLQRTFWRELVLLQKLRFFQRTEHSHQWNPIFHIICYCWTQKMENLPILPKMKRLRSKEDSLCSHKCEQDCFVAFHPTFLRGWKKNCAAVFITNLTTTEWSYLLKKSLRGWCRVDLSPNW